MSAVAPGTCATGTATTAPTNTSTLGAISAAKIYTGYTD